VAARGATGDQPAGDTMTRKTSFYYSFLALPAAERQAITAVFDFCRAVDDAVDLEPDPQRATAA
jgi:phytoene synthase